MGDVGGERGKNQEGTNVIVTVDLDIGGRGVRVIMVEFALYFRAGVRVFGHGHM